MGCFPITHCLALWRGPDGHWEPPSWVLTPPQPSSPCRKTLQLSRQLQDQAVEAQACYSLGNTYTLLQDYERAAEYHLRHLLIAQELADRCAAWTWDGGRGQTWPKGSDSPCWLNCELIAAALALLRHLPPGTLSRAAAWASASLHLWPTRLTKWDRVKRGGRWAGHLQPPLVHSGQGGAPQSPLHRPSEPLPYLCEHESLRRDRQTEHW